MPRPTKLTPQRRKRLVRALADGNTRRTAAALAGIDDSTLRRWLARGHDDDSGPYHTLRLAVEQAEAEAESRMVALINAAAPQTWQAAAWWLERRRPQDWRKRTAVELEGEPPRANVRVVIGKPKIDPRKLSPSTLRELASTLDASQSE